MKSFQKVKDSNSLAAGWFIIIAGLILSIYFHESNVAIACFGIGGGLIANTPLQHD